MNYIFCFVRFFLKFPQDRALGEIEKLREFPMRINSFQNIPSVLQSMKAGSQVKAENSPEISRDSSTVSLSSFGSILQSIQRDVASNASVREAKVNQLADAVQNKTLQMDLPKLAAKLVDLQIIDFKG